MNLGSRRERESSPTMGNATAAEPRLGLLASFLNVAATLGLLLIANGWIGSAQAQSFQGLGGFNYYSKSTPTDVSADGSVVVGFADFGVTEQAFRWTSSGGMVGLGLMAGGKSTATAVSGDGSVVVGYGIAGFNPFTYAPIVEGFRWTASTGLVGLGDLPGGSFGSDATSVSASGAVIVGNTNSASGLEAARWTSGGGWTGLGDLPGGSFFSGASDLSADGSVVAGKGFSASGFEAYRWTSGSSMVGLGDLSGGSFFSQGNAISADGSTIVGESNSTLGREAFRWTSGGGMVGLGDLPGGSFFSEAIDVSGDGSVVVGTSVTFGTGELDAFIWDGTLGMRHLRSVLIADFGLGSALSGWALNAATAISDDGLTIVGYGIGPRGITEGWIADLHMPMAPIPEPETYALLLAGLALLGVVGRTRGRRSA